MTYRQLLKEGEERLGPVPDAEGDALWLLLAAMEITRSEYLCRQHGQADPEKEKIYRDYLTRREQNEPVAYILGEWEFMGLPFYTPAGEVLIPRQDTETLVEEALAEAARRAKASAPVRTVLDLCTGSGCIAVSMAHYLARSQPGTETAVVASDISEKALAVAEKNALRNGVRICFRKGDLWKAVESAAGTEEIPSRYDLILSNPPYIDAAQMAMLPPCVGKYEPGLALAGGSDGLCFYRQLAAKTAEHLGEGGSFFWEIGDEQGEAVRHLIEETPKLHFIRIIQDLAGRDRVVQGSLRSEA